jgi:uncharacterized membrane protein YedE/YeeE
VTTSPSGRMLMLAATAFGLLALLAGGLQGWAYVRTGYGRHLVVGIFAAAVGISVLSGVLAAVLRKR